MSPSAIFEDLPESHAPHGNPAALKASLHTVNGNSNGHVESFVELNLPKGFVPKPNLALYVTKEHEVYQKEIAFPRAKADECIVHVKCTG